MFPQSCNFFSIKALKKVCIWKLVLNPLPLPIQSLHSKLRMIVYNWKLVYLMKSLIMLCQYDASFNFIYHHSAHEPSIFHVALLSFPPCIQYCKRTSLCYLCIDSSSFPTNSPISSLQECSKFIRALDSQQCREILTEEESHILLMLHPSRLPWSSKNTCGQRIAF